VAGVDGVRNGWVTALVGRDGRVRWSTADTAAGVLAVTREAVAVGVDIPLGLPAGERRQCDVLAASRLGTARSSVFPAPPRPVLAAGTYTQACAVARELTGKAISMQTFRIGPKIAEWDAVELPDGVVEVHPELSFRALAPRTEFAGKRSVRGAGQRIAALAGWIDPGAALADLPDGVGLDDVLDALAAAWSAARWATGRAEVLGGAPDARGRPMRVII
jgi:predicted RNase H-like nuclease